MRFHTILLVAGAAITVNCGGGPQVQPSPVTEDPIVTCPSDIAVTAHSGLNPTVSYDVPVAAKGAPPVRVACTPPSGTAFTSGVTGVTCEATDSRQRTASCSFSVVVTAIPQLTKTRLMAFGDSLTEGKTSLIARGVVVTPGTFNTNVSYVEQLDKKIRDRYQDQFVTIIAYGSGGEGAPSTPKCCCCSKA